MDDSAITCDKVLDPDAETRSNEQETKTNFNEERSL